jgi:hypothetical protein
MNNKRNPLHQKNTLWVGPRYFFEGPGVSPDSPEFKRHDLEGRQAFLARQAAEKKRQQRGKKKK